MSLSIELKQNKRSCPRSPSHPEVYPKLNYHVHHLLRRMQRVTIHVILCSPAPWSRTSKQTASWDVSKQSGPKVTTESRVYPWRDYNSKEISRSANDGVCSAQDTLSYNTQVAPPDICHRHSNPSLVICLEFPAARAP